MIQQGAFETVLSSRPQRLQPLLGGAVRGHLILVGVQGNGGARAGSRGVVLANTQRLCFQTEEGLWCCGISRAAALAR